MKKWYFTCNNLEQVIFGMPISFKNSIMININQFFQFKTAKEALGYLEIYENKTPHLMIIPPEPDELSNMNDIDRTILSVQHS